MNTNIHIVAVHRHTFYIDGQGSLSMGMDINQSIQKEGDINVRSSCSKNDFTCYDCSPAGICLHELHGTSYVTVKVLKGKRHHISLPYPISSFVR